MKLSLKAQISLGVIGIGGACLSGALFLLFTSSAAASQPIAVSETQEYTFLPPADQEITKEDVSADPALLSVNTASLPSLDTLPGVGEKTAQKIIDHRPYASLPELVEKKVVTTSLFEKIKDKLTL